MKYFNKDLHVLANFGYYDDQYPNILSCHNNNAKINLDGLYTKNNLLPLKKSEVGLYVHIPFCKTQCLYCDCTVKINLAEEEHKKYLDCIELEALSHYNSYGSKIPVETIYIGGGTPSLLSLYNIKRLFEIIYTYYDTTFTKQLTFESSPYTLSEEKIDYLFYIGVNRLTFGVQTFESSVLKKYNRPQNELETLSIIMYAKKKGIPYINIDLIAGMPGQSIRGFIYTIKIIDKYIKPTSMVVHPFQPTLRTPFSSLKFKYGESDINLRSILIKISLPFINKIRNNTVFLKAQNQQLYDLSYSYKSVIGLGYGAITTIPGKIKFQWEKLSDYYSYFLLKDKSISILSVTCLPKDIEISYISRVLGGKGIYRDEFFDIFGYSIEDTVFFKTISKPKNIGMFIINDQYINYKPNIDRKDRMIFFLNEINVHPLNKDFLDKYKDNGYYDLNIFLTY